MELRPGFDSSSMAQNEGERAAREASLERPGRAPLAHRRMPAMTASEERISMLAQVASLYFEQGLNQGDIADQFGISRASVSRLLAEARELGVVEIRINFPLARNTELEQTLAARFALQAVYVLNTQDMPPERVLGRLGRLASDYLQPRIGESSIVALSWGSAIYETVQAFRRRQLPNVRVVQVIGASGSKNPLIDGPDLARQLAERLGGQYYYLHAPLIVENTYVRDTLLADAQLQQTLELGRQAQLALVGIGSTRPDISPLMRAGYLTEEQQREISAAGAVGDFCGYNLDDHGRLLDIPINRRVIGITLADLRAIPCVVGVAGGAIKAPTILGVLRGELVDVLIIDDSAAREVLRLTRGEG
jgi:deoxyribonucleoside regulator